MLAAVAAAAVIAAVIARYIPTIIILSLSLSPTGSLFLTVATLINATEKQMGWELKSGAVATKGK